MELAADVGVYDGIVVGVVNGTGVKVRVGGNRVTVGWISIVGVNVAPTPEHPDESKTIIIRKVVNFNHIQMIANCTTLSRFKAHTNIIGKRPYRIETHEKSIQTFNWY